jgi:hypothetical protein
VHFISKPAVSRKSLFLLAGIVWSCAGVVLIRFAACWLTAYPGPSIPPLLSFGGGIVLGSLIALFGFRRVARSNINRILLLPEKSCLFAFQKWQGYLLVAFMMSLGMFVRRSQLFHPLFLAAMYTGIGSALLGTSTLYYWAALDREPIPD